MPEGTGGKPGEPGPPGPPGPPGLGADGKQVRFLCERTDGQHENVHKLNQLKFIEKHTGRFLEIGTCLIIFFESVYIVVLLSATENQGVLRSTNTEKENNMNCQICLFRFIVRTG